MYFTYFYTCTCHSNETKMFALLTVKCMGNQNRMGVWVVQYCHSVQGACVKILFSQKEIDMESNNQLAIMIDLLRIASSELLTVKPVLLCSFRQPVFKVLKQQTPNTRYIFVKALCFKVTDSCAGLFYDTPCSSYMDCTGIVRFYIPVDFLLKSCHRIFLKILNWINLK